MWGHMPYQVSTATTNVPRVMMEEFPPSTPLCRRLHSREKYVRMGSGWGGGRGAGVGSLSWRDMATNINMQVRFLTTCDALFVHNNFVINFGVQFFAPNLPNMLLWLHPLHCAAVLYVCARPTELWSPPLPRRFLQESTVHEREEGEAPPPHALRAVTSWMDAHMAPTHTSLGVRFVTWRVYSVLVCSVYVRIGRQLVQPLSCLMAR